MGEQFVTEARQQLDASVRLIRHCLDQLDDAQVWWRPREDMNSVGNLLLHLAGNLKQRFGSVIGGEPDVRDRFGEFTERGTIPKGDLLRRFEEAAGVPTRSWPGSRPNGWARPAATSCSPGRRRSGLGCRLLPRS